MRRKAWALGFAFFCACGGSKPAATPDDGSPAAGDPHAECKPLLRRIDEAKAKVKGTRDLTVVAGELDGVATTAEKLDASEPKLRSFLHEYAAQYRRTATTARAFAKDAERLESLQKEIESESSVYAAHLGAITRHCAPRKKSADCVAASAALGNAPEHVDMKQPAVVTRAFADQIAETHVEDRVLHDELDAVAAWIRRSAKLTAEVDRLVKTLSELDVESGRGDALDGRLAELCGVRP